MGIARSPVSVTAVSRLRQVLKSLNKTYQNLKRRPVAVDLDPKAVTCDELFGIINPATREWKDGDGAAGRGVGVGHQWVSRRARCSEQ